MLNKLVVTSAVLFLLTGGVLLFGPVSDLDTNQTGRLLGGATLVSLGLLTIVLVVKDWLDWRKHYKNPRWRGHK